jgi:hypothetical protein
MVQPMLAFSGRQPTLQWKCFTCIMCVMSCKGLVFKKSNRIFLLIRILLWSPITVMFHHSRSSTNIINYSVLYLLLFSYVRINVKFIYVCANISTFNTIFVPIMRCIGKVPGLGQKRIACLTYSILAAISIKIVSLGKYTAIQLFFSMLQ